MTRHVALKPPCPLCQGRLDAVVRRVPLLGWHMVDWRASMGVTSAGLTGTLISVVLGIRPPKAAPKTLTASFVAASNTWTCCSRPNVRNAGSARK